jgi:hypothetical protein
MMLETLTLKDLIDLGMSAILLVFCWLLWNRLNYVTDFLIKDRIEAQAERRVIAKNAGLTTQDLSREAKAVRQRYEHEEPD